MRIACTLLMTLCPALAGTPVHPVPQKAEVSGGNFQLARDAKLTGESTADPASVAILKARLSTLPAGSGATRIIIGERGDQAVAQHLAGLPEKSGAYRLSIRDGVVVIVGHDGRGTYYGVRTLAQLLADIPGKLPAAEIIDWPEIPHRGVVEGFYGTPWSHEKRLSLIRFLGDWKMDTYIYGPKDDPFHSSPNWRKPYPAAEAARIRELADACREQHVDFVWAIHPGKDIKWTDEDFGNVKAKFEAMYDLGVRAFSVFFDDISGEGTKADQQARLLNYLHTDFVERKGDVLPLVMCPTQYNKSWSGGDYLDILGERLHPSIEVMWTGDRVISDLDRPSMEWINGRLKREAYIWWNFPVSDYVRNHLLMGPAYGNAPDIGPLYGGFVSNPMERSEASKVALFGVAGYAWHPAAHDATAAWKAGIRVMMPGAADAFETFCAHNSDLGANGHGYRREESVEFAPKAAAFLTAFRDGKNPDAKEVRTEMEKIAKAPAAIRKNAANPMLLDEIGPWLDAFEKLGQAGIESLDAAHELDGDDVAAAWSHLAKAHAALSAMEEIDRTQNRNPHQPGISTGSLVVTPFVREVVTTTGARLLARLSGKPVLRLSPIASSASRETMAAMLDGKEDTFFYNKEVQKKDDWFGVDLGGKQEVKKIRIVQGRNDGDHDLVHTGVLEGYDGKEWRELAKAGGVWIEVALERPAILERIRLRVTKPGKADGSKNDVWTAIREFEVNPRDAAELRTDVPGLANQPVRMSEDGALSVSPAFEVHRFAAGKFLGLLLPEAAEIGSVTVDLKVAGPARYFALEGSSDGKGWRKLDATEDGTKLTATHGGPLRAVRLRNHGKESQEVTLAAFTVALKRKADAFAAGTDSDVGTTVAMTDGVTAALPLPIAAKEAVLLLGEGDVSLTAETRSGRHPLGRVRGPFAKVSLPAGTTALLVTGKATIHEVVAVSPR
ncbi:MAG TPA: beta-N-acetylglucosaminidase domain-containing protein [Haloferula sp.]